MRSPARQAAVAAFSRRLPPLARRLRMIADHALAEIGLSDATGWVLLHVGRLGGEPRQTELAAAVDMNGPGLVRLIDCLEKRGLVERQVDAADRRINRVRLTDAGRAITDGVERALRETRAKLFEGVSDEDLATANSVLRLLDEHVLAHLEARR